MCSTFTNKQYLTCRQTLLVKSVSNVMRHCVCSLPAPLLSGSEDHETTPTDEGVVGCYLSLEQAHSLSQQVRQVHTHTHCIMAALATALTTRHTLYNVCPHYCSTSSCSCKRASCVGLNHLFSSSHKWPHKLWMSYTHGVRGRVKVGVV